MSRASESVRARDHIYDAAFGEYIAGRTIACVGPAPITDDERAQILDHDLIYLIAAQRTQHDLDPNIVFLNRHGVGALLRGKQYYEGFDWVVTKSAPHGRPNTRRARYSANINLNQVPIVAEDLTHFRPADVSIYGADLYFGGPGTAYLEVYDPSEPERVYRGIAGHNPPLQHQHLRRIWQQTGWFSRSDRFRQVLELDTDVYYRELRARWVPVAVGAPA